MKKAQAKKIKPKTVAIMIHTFLRDDLMYRCVDSVLKFMPDAKIYLSDGGRMTTKKRLYYDNLIQGGHYVKHYDEYNYWWRKAFNEKVSIANEDLIIKIDDDFYFKDDSNLNEFIDIMKFQSDINLLGGKVFHEHLQKPSPFIYSVVEKIDDKYRLEFAKTDCDINYCDYVPDFWIARKDFLLNNPMADNLKPAQGGHEKFFTDIYESKYQGSVAYTPLVVAYHEKGSQSNEYKRQRSSGLSEHNKISRVIKP